MNVIHLAQTYEHNPHHEVELFQIAHQMKLAGLSDEFISAAIRTALEYEGVSDLVMMWANETDPIERDETVADIQEMIDECSQSIEAAPQVHFNDLNAIAKDIRRFKDSLLEIVMKQGGIKQLSEKTGIPQPSLSRFFNSNAMPRRATLLKISRALKLHAIEVEERWLR